MTTVSSSQSQTVSSGQTVSGTYVSRGGTASATLISANAYPYVSGGTTTGTAVGGGCQDEVVLSSGGAFAPAAAANGTSAVAPEVTVAHLIHAAASFDTGSADQATLFEPPSGSSFHVESSTLAAEHHAGIHR